MKNTLKQMVEADLYRYTTKISKKLMIKNFIFNPGFKYMYFHRKYNHHKSKGNTIRKYWYRLKLYKYKIKYLYEISGDAKIGKGFYIGHLGPVIINPNAVIGENVNISSGVTIGQHNRGKRAGSPIIGNRVFIGANSLIIGKVNIGDNVLIAPGARVNFDVPSNSIVVGNPAKIKTDENATYKFIGSIIDN